jgi:hypothetical protein
MCPLLHHLKTNWCFGYVKHTLCVRLIQGKVTAATRHGHGPEVEDERHLKNFVVIFVFIEVFYTVR